MKTAATHQLSMTVLMTPDMANFAGNVHGGHILKLLDQVVFRQPIHVGELVTFLASINYTGTTSMEVGIKVVTENIRSQVVRHANSCFFTMVAVNDDGKPVQVPQLVPGTADERRRFEAAKARRDLRREFEARAVAMKASAASAQPT